MILIIQANRYKNDQISQSKSKSGNGVSQYALRHNDVQIKEKCIVEDGVYND